MRNAIPMDHDHTKSDGKNETPGKQYPGVSFHFTCLNAAFARRSAFW